MNSGFMHIGNPLPWPRRVAIIHYWLVGMRGGEKVLEEILTLFPNAEIFTHVADRAALSDRINRHKIHETGVARLPFARSQYQKYLGFMPRALEEIDLSGFDLVISSESGPAKGVIVPPGVPHICYVHSPMRYIWDMYPAYRDKLGLLQRAYLSRLSHRLRVWDVTSAARVDRFVANSRFVAARIRKYYRRDADIVHPPVDLESYRPGPSDATRDGYLFVSELVPYKRADAVIEAFRGLDAKLTVIGSGSELKRLRRDAPANVTLLGRVPAGALPGFYQNAKALIFPALEDFGIVPLEAMASGTPVLAYGRGGALDTVIPGTSGLLFDDQSTEAIRDAVQRFEVQSAGFSPAILARHARGFAPDVFRQRFSAIVLEEMARVCGDGPPEVDRLGKVELTA
jgi:glycosyltransferase involved in cell wall biosynthesis